MKIKIRPVKGETFEVETSAEHNIKQLKQAIADAKPEFPAEQQKLILAGRVLADEMSVGDQGLKDTDFIVVLLCKPKASSPAPKAAATPESAPAAAPPAAATPAAAAPATAPTAAATAAGPPEGAVSQLCEMGFPREKVVECLRAAFNNPARAVEYLTTGLPERARSRSPPRQAQSQGPAAAPQNSPGAAGGQSEEGTVAAVPSLAFPAMSPGPGDGEGGATAGILQQLRNHPQFGELSAMVLQDPSVLPQFIAAISSQNPELAEAIRSNQEEFLAHLAEDAAEGEEEEEGEEPVEVHMSDADRAALDRLMALGFSEEQALEAYLACDRQEELAANFLFDNMSTG